MIETLKAELIADGSLGDSQDFAADLTRAANRRVAFTDFVDENVLAKSEQGTRSMAAVLGSGDFITGAAALITALKDAGMGIWREYRSADKEQKEQIRDQLDSLKWRSFGDVPALG